MSASHSWLSDAIDSNSGARGTQLNNGRKRKVTIEPAEEENSRRKSTEAQNKFVDDVKSTTTRHFEEAQKKRTR